MISDDTPILPAMLAAVAAGRLPELKGKPLQPLIDRLVSQAETEYSTNAAFRNKVQRRSQHRGEAFLAAMMRGWAEEWAKRQIEPPKRVHRFYSSGNDEAMDNPQHEPYSNLRR